MRVLVLGAYGLIGIEVARALMRAGHDVTGLARSRAKGEALLPDASWIKADLEHLLRAEDWHPHLKGIDVVVNAAGALQSGLRDNVKRTQQDSMLALFEACESAGISRFIQISAVGVSETATTEFMRTKAIADEGLRTSGLDWVILKPGLVISPTAHGGTVLLRMLAAFPVVQPISLPDARMQTIHVDDVAEAVVRCLDDPAVSKQTFDLVEDETHTLEQVVLEFRRWLGFGSPALVVRIPGILSSTLAKLADMAGWLGWRAPLRSTALKVLESDVTGDPAPWCELTGQSLRSLSQSLATLPSSRQERQFARLQLIWPLLIAMFSFFWIASGLIGIHQAEAAANVLPDTMSRQMAATLIYGGAALDILIGGAMLFRRWFKTACLGAIAVSFGYLLAGTVLTPELWLDPLGPFLKIFPVIGLAAALFLQGDER